MFSHGSLHWSFLLQNDNPTVDALMEPVCLLQPVNPEKLQGWSRLPIAPARSFISPFTASCRVITPIINPTTRTDPIITNSADRITPFSSCHKQFAKAIHNRTPKFSRRIPTANRCVQATRLTISYRMKGNRKHVNRMPGKFPSELFR